MDFQNTQQNYMNQNVNLMNQQNLQNSYLYMIQNMNNRNNICNNMNNLNGGNMCNNIHNFNTNNYIDGDLNGNIIYNNIPNNIMRNSINNPNYMNSNNNWTNNNGIRMDGKQMNINCMMNNNNQNMMNNYNQNMMNNNNQNMMNNNMNNNNQNMMNDNMNNYNQNMNNNNQNMMNNNNANYNRAKSDSNIANNNTNKNNKEISMGNSYNNKNNNININNDLKNSSFINDQANNHINWGSKLKDFEIIKDLGFGQFGKVKKAKSKINSNNYFAIKEIHINKFNEKQKQNILREREATKAVNCENVVKLIDVFEEKGNMYFVLEYVDGINLEKFINNNRDLNIHIKEDKVINIFKQILKGLKCIHDCQIIHRDIKPDNILITNKFEVKITDFGIAAFQRENENINYGDYDILFSNYTRTGRPDYVSPEILAGNKKYDYKTDIYSLGLTIFNLMTFKLPFELKVDMNQRYYREPNGVSINEEIYSEELINLVMKMIKEDPNDRPTAKEAYDELEKIIKRINNNKGNNQYSQNNQEMTNNVIQRTINNKSSNSSLSCIIHILFSIKKIKEFFSSDSTGYQQIQNLKNNETIIKDLIELLDYMNQDSKNDVNNNLFEMEILPQKRNDIAKKIKLFKGNDEVLPLDILGEIFNEALIYLKDINLDNNIFYKNDLSNIFPENKHNKIDTRLYNELHNTINDFTYNYKNIFADIFYFVMLKNYVICPNCKTPIDTKYEVENYLNFELNMRNANIKLLLKKCMENNCVEENNKFCRFCSYKLCSFNKFLNTPLILIINFDKKIGKVTLDEEINLSEYTLTNIGPKKYYLFAVIVIDKRKSENHYITFIKLQNRWNCIDDGQETNCCHDDITDIGIPSLAFYKGIS